MNITSGQKKLALGVVILAVLGGAAAYIFLDPFAEEATPVVVAPKPQPRAAKPAEKPPVAPASAVAAVAASETTPATPAQELQSPLKSSSSIKSAKAKPVSPPSADLRHCLDQPTNLEIAKCAGE